MSIESATELSKEAIVGEVEIEKIKNNLNEDEAKGIAKSAVSMYYEPQEGKFYPSTMLGEMKTLATTLELTDAEDINQTNLYALAYQIREMNKLLEDIISNMDNPNEFFDSEIDYNRGYSFM